ncbi:hypothetical protein [Caproiciproducens sp. LBM24188]|nr:hypothetical protein [Oscillospiraceae bacterium]HHV32426.1 hypothetical protein [Clostridiales bacterium]
MNSNRISLNQMITDLLQIDDVSWGYYAFTRELLRDRISDNQKREMILRSIQCGEAYADRVIQETGRDTPRGIAEYFQLRVESSNLTMTGKRALFAQYTPPDLIEILSEPIEKYRAVLAGLSQEEAALLPKAEELSDILLGHELFHFLEDRHENEIYTRTEKILLWRIFGFRNYSSISVLGEIAGMAFSKKLNHLPYSPFLLDVLLYFGYNPEGAKSIYQSVIDIGVEGLGEKCLKANH